MLERFIGFIIKGTWQFILYLLWLGLWLFGLALILGYVLRWWPGERVVLVRLMSSLTPWLMIGLVPGVLLAGLGRRYGLMTFLAIPMVAITFTYAPLFLPRTNLALAADNSLTVMSYNIWRRNKDMMAVASLIEQEQPDILLLQELKPYRVQPLLTALDDLYPETKPDFAYDPYTLQGVISRYPLTVIETSRPKGRLQKVIVETPNGPINVWNVHIHAFPWRRQYAQIQALYEDLATVEGPLILGGDFNATDQSETYQLIDSRLYNAHWQAGWGFGFTFPSNWGSTLTHSQIKKTIGDTPLIRIDHIFYNDHFYAYTAKTLAKSGGSDHSPVVATLLWRR